MKTFFGLFLLLNFLSFSSAAVYAEVAPVIAIHGGAGTIKKSAMSAEQEQAIRKTLADAIGQGYQRLKSGHSSLEAITTSITILENSPYFNAGVGAVYNYQGEHELDASIMDGSTLNAGAVAGVKRIKNPILLAQDVMTKSEHVMLAGEGAEQFAESLGYQFVENSIFDTDVRFKAWQKARNELEKDTQAKLYSEYPEFRFGTVGAVALDKNGNLAAGTSTGGMTVKRWGRIGDSPIIGAGTYADNASCAVSATGHGEYFIRYNVAADVCARVKYKNISIAKAADEVINKALVKAGGTGGVIVVGNQGDIALTFNTTGMYRAWVDKDGKFSVAIYREN